MCGRRDKTRFKNMSDIEKQFWTFDDEGHCMCWKCHGQQKHKLQRESALSRDSASSTSEAAHVPSKEVYA